MANNPRQAPWPITATAGTAADGKPSVASTIGSSTYTCEGDSATLALLALARRLIEEGCDPRCATTGTGGVLSGLYLAI
jgi:hypothetical protein